MTDLSLYQARNVAAWVAALHRNKGKSLKRISENKAVEEGKQEDWFLDGWGALRMIWVVVFGDAKMDD